MINYYFNIFYKKIKYNLDFILISKKNIIKKCLED